MTFNVVICTEASHERSKNPMKQVGIVIWALAGKGFSDMRQKERRIKFIRVGDADRAAGQLKGELALNRCSLVHFYTQGTRSGIGVLWVIC